MKYSEYDLQVRYLKSNFEDFNKFVDYYTTKSTTSRQKGLNFINSLKKECYFCSSTENLDFLHKNPLNKRYAVNQMAKMSQKSIQEEVDKCWCVCKCCKKKISARLTGSIT